MQHLESFFIIGISVRTGKENDQYATDIPALWGRFMGEGLSNKIPNKVAEEVYCAYTDYESDHNGAYTTVLGCKVSSLEQIPEGFIGLAVPGGDYAGFTAKGNLNEGAVVQAWFNIWESDLDRCYATDFEVYGAKAQNPADAEVDIYVGTK